MTEMFNLNEINLNTIFESINVSSSNSNKKSFRLKSLISI